MCECVCVCIPGREASGLGQTGDAQHSQEADCLPAGSAGHRHGEEICQVALRECPIHHSHTDVLGCVMM